MQTILENLKSLSVITSRLEKIDFLERLKDDDTKYVLKFLNDESIITGLSNKKINKKIHVDVEFVAQSLRSLLDYLSVNNTGRDVDIKVVQNFLETCDEMSLNDVKKIVTKTYKTGVTAKTLNKVYGDDFIRVMELQLAESYSKYADKVQGDFAITIKYDGHRTISNGQENRFFTRSGKPIVGLTDVERELKLLQSSLTDDRLILDGELLVKDSQKPKDEWFNETTKIINSNGEKVGVKYIVFDGLSHDEFYSKKESRNNYKERRDYLESVFSTLDLQFIELAPILYYGDDVNKIPQLFQQAIEDGEEGIMINLNTPYYCKRTRTLLKVKPTQSADLEIVGFEEGSGKYEGKLGALLVDFDGVTVGIGSGLTDHDREVIWNHQQDYLGKIAEIQYTSVSKNQKGDELNLRFPRFKTIRLDKTKDDVNIEH